MCLVYKIFKQRFIETTWQYFDRDCWAAIGHYLHVPYFFHYLIFEIFAFKHREIANRIEKTFSGSSLRFWLRVIPFCSGDYPCRWRNYFATVSISAYQCVESQWCIVGSSWSLRQFHHHICFWLFTIKNNVQRK